jgi:LacI family transcriptional regulator
MVDQPKPYIAIPRRPQVEHSRAVTMRDIAERCGVTKQTVSRVLMGDPRVSAVTRERILTLAGELGYDPTRHHAARQMALRKHGLEALNQVIAVFFPPYTYRSNFVTDLFWGIWEGLNESGYALLAIYSRDPRTDTVPEIPAALKRGEVDGAIIHSRPGDLANTLDELRAEQYFGNRPIVFSMWTHPGCSAVTADYAEGAYAAACHLLAQGHRHLLHIYHAPDVTTHPVLTRIEAYERAYRAHDLNPSRYLHAFAWHDADDARSLAQCLEHLRAYPEITGVLARNDLNAAQLAHNLYLIGKRVPDDISLIGCDDTDPLLNEFGQNILSTVRLPLQEIGRQAARLAIARVTGGQAQDCTQRIPTTFIPRASTAPPL